MRSAIGWRFFLLAVLIISGCGSTPSSSKKSRAPRRVGGGADSSAVADHPLAHKTREATLDRRGSWSLTSDKVQEVTPLVEKNAETYGLPPDLIYAIIWVESRFNPRARSPVGARGLMQLMPKTAKYLADCIGWDGRARVYDPEFNVTAGTYYIARLIQEFKGDEALALAAYNAGPGKVRRWIQDDGLPKVSIEYATMVQTARTFFEDSRAPSPKKPKKSAPQITDDDLDRLGLTILIAGLSDTQFGLEREDAANPFE